MNPPPVPLPWSFPRRVLFRFGVVYFLLYALPFPFLHLLQLASSFLRVVHFGVLGGELKSTPSPEFFTRIYEARAWYTKQWERLTSKVAQRWNEFATDSDWTTIDVIHQRTGSGDTAHDFMRIAIIFVIATVCALLWSFVQEMIMQRRHHHHVLSKWLHLGVRWYVGFVLLSYGLLKIYSTQFGDPSLHRLSQPLGDYSPMGLVWTFMAFSEPYEMFSGFGETIGGLLLFWRPTAILGCLVTIPVMGNVVLLNWMYDVPVKFSSAHLLLFTFALLIPELRRLFVAFFTDRTPPRSIEYSSATSNAGASSSRSGGLWILLHLVSNHLGFSEMRKARYTPAPELYGVWLVDEMKRDGKLVDRTDVTRWKSLSIDKRDRGMIRTITDRRTWLTVKEDIEAGRIRVQPMGGKEEEPPKPWTFERGTKMIKIPNPEPKKMAEYTKLTEVEHETLELKGWFRGQLLELKVHRKQFRLNRGFHLIQELPYNR